MKKSFTIFIIVMFVMTGCAGGTRSHTLPAEIKPNDELSQYLVDNLEDNFIYFQNIFEGSSNHYSCKQYYFYGTEISAESVQSFADVVRGASLEEGTKYRISVIVSTNSGTGGAFGFRNYLSDESESADYSGFDVLVISGQDGSYRCLDEPATYTQIEGIKYLLIESRMYQQSLDDGVDWYGIWPELEGIDTF